ncbi:MAG: transcriptional regulator, partial [Nitrososphaera sp.]
AIHVVKEGGSAILLAESREGVGGGALQMYVEGRLEAEQLAKSPYIDGLEHLLYLQELGQKYELGIVSTLPHYYANKKLGFTTYASMKDIMQRLPDRHGKNYRAIVLSDADITLLRPKI